MEVKPDHALKYLNQKLNELEAQEVDLVLRLDKVQQELKNVREKIKDFRALLGLEIL